MSPGYAIASLHVSELEVLGFVREDIGFVQVEPDSEVLDPDFEQGVHDLAEMPYVTASAMSEFVLALTVFGLALVASVLGLVDPGSELA